MKRTPGYRLVAAAVLAAALTACSSTAGQQAVDSAAARHRATPPPPPAPPAPAPIDIPASAPAPALQSIQVTGTRYPSVGVPTANTENYAEREDNPVRRASEQPLSTFSIDVDTGSYSNVRRMLFDGVRPPADAVRAEEFINYFDYGHPAPDSGRTPFRVTTELAPAPWNARRQVLMIGIQGFDVPREELPPANLVLLIDTSGSMHSADKLPLLKRALSMLARQLRPQDRLSIVVYAGSAGLVLPPTAGDRQGEILAALGQLEAGGSTNGGEGIALAYAMARQAHIDGGINRVILATDGDFNVGTVDAGALETLVADQRDSGIALSTLGFGRGNYNDALAEKLADVGNGNHAYIDSALEARRVLVEEMGSTLLTIASDVKVQVEFNPAVVAEYRLIGYENRLLRDEDFANDQVDAGEIGAGHSVTALYEITPVGSDAARLPPLRYGEAAPPAADTHEVAHLRLRYKQPGSGRSQLIEQPILLAQLRDQPGDGMRLAAAVAGFADLLRGGSRFDGWTWEQVAATAREANRGHSGRVRAELVELIGMAQALVEPAPTPDMPAAGG